LLACPADGKVLVLDDHSQIPASQVLADVSDLRLKVVRNSGSSGAARARNQAVALAEGAVVFFLDDDDEVVANYCTRVLGAGGAAAQAQWGFSSTVIRTLGSTPSDRPLTRKRLRRGVVPHGGRVRDRIAAMSDGFWIKKSCFEDAGGLDPDLTIDEDTDLCIRLLGAGISPWYECEPGMAVYRGYLPAQGSAGQLTTSTPLLKGLTCYRRTFEKNEGAFPPLSAPRWFLASRFIRRAIRQGQKPMAWEFVEKLHPGVFRGCAMGFLLLKLTAYQVRLFFGHR
jgi:hypothetical protein